MCTPQIGSRTSRRAPWSLFKSPADFNGSRVRPGCSKPEINRPARRTPHETITTQKKNLINRARKVIAFSATASIRFYELNDVERIPIGAGGKTTTANSQELTKDAVNRVYARSKGRVKRKGAISVSCEGRGLAKDQYRWPRIGINLRLICKLSKAGPGKYHPNA
jgi:hypothetical protein